VSYEAYEHDQQDYPTETILHLAPTEAYALKIEQKMTLAGLHDSGFEIKTQNRKEGTVEFTLTRDLLKAKTFQADSDLQIRRVATIKVFGKSGLLAQCDIEPNTQKNTVTYRFTMARECVDDSRFTLAEIDDYKDQTREHLLGGGTFYEFRLALFVDKTP
jgi:hypothetical protein